MRIDGPNSLNAYEAARQSPGGAREAAPGGERGEAADPADAAGVDAEARPYVGKALAADDVNLEAVAEARRLLGAGELDTPEATRRAAERILSDGI